MWLIFEHTVSALAEAIIRERCENAEAGSPAAHAAVAQFLLKTQAAMPDYLRLPLKSLTVAFGLSALVTAGRPFHRLPHQRRLRQVRAWKESALGPRRDLVKFYETLAIFGWYSELYGQDYSNDPADRNHHAQPQ